MEVGGFIVMRNLVVSIDAAFSFDTDLEEKEDKAEKIR